MLKTTEGTASYVGATGSNKNKNNTNTEVKILDVTVVLSGCGGAAETGSAFVLHFMY